MQKKNCTKNCSQNLHQTQLYTFFLSLTERKKKKQLLSLDYFPHDNERQSLLPAVITAACRGSCDLSFPEKWQHNAMPP